MNVCLGLGKRREKSDAWPRCEVSEGVSDEDASDVDKGDFYVEKGASKSGCGCTLGIGVHNLGLLVHLHPQRNIRLPLS